MDTAVDLPTHDSLPPKEARKPAYFVVYQPVAPTERAFVPITVASQADFESGATLPHLLDRDFKTALAALWYCLHLPATCFEFKALQAIHLKKLQGFDFAHEIVLLPVDVLAEVCAAFDDTMLRPVVVFADDRCCDTVRDMLRKTSWNVDLVPFSAVDPSRLQADWDRIAARMEMTNGDRPRAPSFCERLDVGPLLVPIRSVRRQFPGERELEVPGQSEDVEIALAFGMHLQTVVATVANLESRGFTPEAANQAFEAEYEHQSANLRLPVVVGLPGLPASYCRAAYPSYTPSRFFSGWTAFDPADTFAALRSSSPDRVAERAVIEITTTRRARAATGLGFMMDAASTELFGKVGELEKHCCAGAEKPKFVWRTLDHIGQGMAQRLTALQSACLGRASQITAFTNFPFGWTILPGDSAPVMCRVPIAYCPLLPLTRTLQYELRPQLISYFGESLRILLAEAIPLDDHLHEESIAILRFIAREFEGHPKIDVRLCEIADAASLRSLVADYKPNILLLSSHGVYDARRRVAGLAIGDEISLGPDLGPMPPLIVLSACHASPRGDGCINIGELLLRQGAQAVISNQIPINVRRNATLMVRFFTYIAESMEKREDHRTIADVWHRTTTSNAINDIVHANERVLRWAHTRVDDEPSPLEHFMSVRSSGQLRLGHIYHDSERVLRDIAMERGAPPEVIRIIDERDYVPETLFYLVLGRPDRIRLNDPVLESFLTVHK